MKSLEIVVVSAIAALLLAGGVNFARGKQDVVVEGVAVQQNLVYDFYPNAKDCATKALLIFYSQNAGFSDAVGETTDADHLDRLFHSTWKLKIRGDLSRVGRSAFAGGFAGVYSAVRDRRATARMRFRSEPEVFELTSGGPSSTVVWTPRVA